ncbi:MAG: hypothetical protein N3B01_06800 [Verrucomicrobiae bacterium]|nr:hypothetical protein [Verrucomicrobiae bacterium]
MKLKFLGICGIGSGMKHCWIFLAAAVVAVAAQRPAPKSTEKPPNPLVGKPTETWCIGPIVAIDPQAGTFTIVVKSQGQSVQTQTEGPRFLGSFIIASSSDASEEQRSFECLPHCRFVTPAKPAGATLGDFRVGDTVRVTCVGTNAPWKAIQVTYQPPSPPRR